METFLFFFGRPEGPAADFLRQAGEHLVRVMPDAGVPLRATTTFLEGANAGWCRIEPRGMVGLPVLDQVVEDEQAVLVFGDLAGVPENQTARWIAHEGVDDAPELNGSFGAVFVDRLTGRVSLLTDLIGFRTLRYVATDDFIIASPHDLTLLASGLVDLSLDAVSAISIMTGGWSFGGRSLLSSVGTSHPLERTHWHDGTLTREPLAILDPGQRIDKRDTRRLREHLNAMAEVARGGGRSFAAAWPDFGVQLTAGLDSRATLAALMPVIDPARTFVQTTGDAGSPDVQTAKRIADHYGLTFRATRPHPPSPDDFLHNVDLFAFSMNGDTNAKRAPQVSPVYAQRTNALAWGGAGEIYRGRYYPTTERPPLRPDDAMGLIQSVYWRDLPFADPAAKDRWTERLKEHTDHFATYSSNGYDVLNLFFVHDRFSVWGSIKDRFTWMPTAFWSPFMNRHTLRMSYRLPAPIGDHAHLHATLIRQTMPWAYWVRVNHEALIPLTKPGQSHPFLVGVDRQLSRIGSSIQARLSPTYADDAGAGHEVMQADMFAGPLAETVQDLVTQPGGISLEVFGNEGVETLVREHMDGTRNRIQFLGRMVTMERWLHLARAFSSVPR